MKTKSDEPISKPRSSRGHEAQIIRKTESPHVGCSSFERASYLYKMLIILGILFSSFSTVYAVECRYIRFEKNSPNLSLAEVEVLSSGRNVARTGTATQSSTLSGYDATANKAVDGTTEGSFGSGSVSHTDSGDATSWWQLDLGSQAGIDHINIWNRTDCCGDRLDGVVLKLLDSSQNVIYQTTLVSTSVNPSISYDFTNGLSSVTTGPVPTTLKYSATDDGAILGIDGKRFFNRPLYINNEHIYAMAGDLPCVLFLNQLFANSYYKYGTFMAAIVRNGTGKWLHESSTINSKYHAGKMRWEITDASLPGLTVIMETVPMKMANGLTIKISISGALAGDQMVWLYGGAAHSTGGGMQSGIDPFLTPSITANAFLPSDCSGNSITINNGIFSFPNTSAYTVGGKCSVSSTLKIADANSWTDPVRFFNSTGASNPAVCGKTELQAGINDLYWAMESFTGTSITDSSRIDVPMDSFYDGISKSLAISTQVMVNTPDPYFDAGVSAACLAMNGLWNPPIYVHGTMGWNWPYIGWRSTYGPAAFGWYENVKFQGKTYIGFQGTTDAGLTARSDPNAGYVMEAPDSRFYGKGHINKDQGLYNMQTQFFDQQAYAWRWSPQDSTYESILRNGLELHLNWQQECFDPDGDGLYESYINTWPTDNIWYNGGGSIEESCYAYNGQIAAMDLARRAGDTASEQSHKSMADKIKQSIFQGLWIPSKGYMGVYRDQNGHKRLHEDSWLYAIFLPIESGIVTREQAAQSLYYTEYGLLREKMPFGGQQCWNSNWVPGSWSHRVIQFGENSSLAYAYFKTGLADQGYDLLKGNFLDTMYNSAVPGSMHTQTLPQNVGVEFADCSSPFSRTVVEGVFGIMPDYPNGIVKCSPSFPYEWDNASFKMPDFGLVFNRTANSDTYQFTLTRQAKVSFSVPVKARNITGVTLNGVPVSWTQSPGFGQVIVDVESAQTNSAILVIGWTDKLPKYESVHLEGNSGDNITLVSPLGNITECKDPQGVLTGISIVNGVINATLTTNDGNHMVMAVVDLGNGLKAYTEFKIKVTNVALEAYKANKTVRTIPDGAQWDLCDISSLFNGDITTIFKQQYLSPRPKTCSVRIGVDGWSAWIGGMYRQPPPTIDLSNVPGMLDSGKLVTPQGVRFNWPGSAGTNNIIFTSRWDNWPHKATVPVDKTGDVLWMIVAGTTNAYQCRIVNGTITMNYDDGTKEVLDLIPPENFWGMCINTGGSYYDYNQDNGAKFALPKIPPLQVQLGGNCNAMLYGWRLKQGVAVSSVTIETLSEEGIIGLMGLTVQCKRSTGGPEPR